MSRVERASCLVLEVGAFESRSCLVRWEVQVGIVRKMRSVIVDSRTEDRKGPTRNARCAGKFSAYQRS